jgi:hypothetical protein
MAYHEPYTTTDTETKYRSNGDLNGRSQPSTTRRTRKSSTSKSGLVKILLEGKIDAENMKVQLEQAYAYIRAESRRANEAERILQEAKERLKGLMLAKQASDKAAERAQAELRMYKVQYENAQMQMQRANEMIQESDMERDKARRQMEKMKEALEKYKEAELMRRAREEGWRAGREDGYRSAQAEAAARMEEEYEEEYAERMRQHQEPPHSVVDQPRTMAVEPTNPVPGSSQQPPHPGPQPLTEENVTAFSTPRSGAHSADTIIVHPAPVAQPEPISMPEPHLQTQTPPAIPIPPPGEHSDSHTLAMPIPRPRPDHIIVRSPLDATPVYPHARPLSRASTINARRHSMSIPQPQPLAEEDEDDQSSQSSCPTPEAMIRPLSSASRRTVGTTASGSHGQLRMSGVPRVQTTTPAPDGGNVSRRGSMRSVRGYGAALHRMS